MLRAIAAAVVGGVFLLSGVAKLVSPQVWRAQASVLGAPGFVARPLPIVEVALGACLVVQLWLDVIGWMAVGVLVAFTSLLVIRLAQGRRPPCTCFGSLSRKPISWLDVARNASLVVAAAIVAMG